MIAFHQSFDDFIDDMLEYMLDEDNEYDLETYFNQFATPVVVCEFKIDSNNSVFILHDVQTGKFGFDSEYSSPGLMADGPSCVCELKTFLEAVSAAFQAHDITSPAVIFTTLATRNDNAIEAGFSSIDDENLIGRPS